MQIWIIDDNPSDVLLIELALRRAGIAFTSEVVPDGESALRKFAEAKTCPDVILIDMHLPRVDGFEVLDALRSAPILGNVPACAISSSASAQDRARALELGANIYLQKASDLSTFLSSVEGAVRELAAASSARP